MKISPQEAHSVIGKHMLFDADEMVFDLKKSQGSYIYDSKHNLKFLDFASCFASSPIGYNHPKLQDPVFKEKLAYVAINKVTNSDYYTTEMAEFVDTFSKIAIPNYLPHLFLIDGGGPAVDNAIKTAIDWKTRKRDFLRNCPKIIYFRHAFHGRTGYSLSVTNTYDERKTKYFPRIHGWLCIPTPKIKFPLHLNIERIKEFEKTVLNYIKYTLTLFKNEIAAIIVEPIQGEGGDNHFRSEFVQALRDVTNEEDVLLIFDEVQTGVGLTGKMWAHEHFDVKPDIMVFGKKMQVAGILCGPKIDEVENNVFKESSRINSTFGGNLVDMVRAQKYLEIIKKEELVRNAAEMGKSLLLQLKGLQSHCPRVDNARGKGLMCAIDLPTTQERDRVKEEAYRKGLILLGCGERSIRFRPALNVSSNEIDNAIHILKRSIR